MPKLPLAVARLRRTCSPRTLKFETTASLPLVEDIIGQPRAVRAFDFGLDVRGPGFNLFVMGPVGSGRTTIANYFLQRYAAQRPTPGDWVYVHNFKEPLRPRAMWLPAGQARQFKQDMGAVRDFLKTDLPRLFESDTYQRAASRLTRELDEARTLALAEFDEQARQRGFALAHSEQGLLVLPLGENGEPLESPEALKTLPEKRRAELDLQQAEVEDDLNTALRAIRGLEQQTRDQLLELDRQAAAKALAPLLNRLIERYHTDCPEAAEYLEEVRAEIVAHAAQFHADTTEADPDEDSKDGQRDPLLHFQVNMLVDNSQLSGAPIVFENNPTFMNLIGRIERDVSVGENVLDFTMLRPGALHRANGGYLVLQASDVLKDQHAWEAFKRALKTQRIVIEDPGTQLQMFSTRTLESEPIPLDVKVILLGTPWMYYQLFDTDEDFARLFKVKADFAADMARTPDNELAYALFVRARCTEYQLPPFDASAVAQLIEYGSRLVEDQLKLSVQFGDITDALVEAAHWAQKADRAVVTAADVRQALAEWRYRSNLVEQETQEPIIDGMINVQVRGEVVGQINGLSVIMYGDYEFGHPSRISARIYVGRSGVLMIEREVHLTGRIHNKGLLTLEGYLHGQYATTEPLSLGASLSFEQNYAEIEGDSASSAELYALLSALADLPIKQGIAVTGSVDQQGRLQPVGGVSHKIEGFFDICRARGLTSEQGVIVPASNIRNLMLREDVVAACRAGQFQVWAVETIDEGLELLTGVKAGRRGKSGRFTKDSVHARVAARLKSISDQLDGKREHEEEPEEKVKPEEKETRNRKRRKKQ